MSSGRRALGLVRVAVTLHDPCEHSAGEPEAALRDELLGYVEDFLNSLALPQDVELSVTRAETGATGRVAPYTTTVNGSRCRTELRIANPSSRPDGRLAAQIAEDLCANRRLFLPASVANRLYAKWSNERTSGGAWLSQDDFRGFLLQLVERGIRIDRLQQWFTTWEPAADTRACQLAFEEAIAGSDATGISLFLGDAALRTLRASIAPGDTRTVDASLGWFSRILFSERGLLLGPPSVRTDWRLGQGEFRIQVNDCLWPPIQGLAPDEWLVLAPAAHLREHGIAGTDAVDFWTGLPCVRVMGGGALEERSRKAADTLGVAGVIVARLRALALREAPHLLTIEAVRHQLAALRQTEPALVDAVACRFDAFTLTDILRDLLSSGVSARDFRNILEILLSIEGTKLSSIALARSGAPLPIGYWADCVRAGLKRQISFEHAPSGTLYVHLLASALEERIASIGTRPLDEEEHSALVEALARAQASRPDGRLVVLTRQELARPLRSWIRCELPRAAVIGYDELSPDVNVQPLGTIAAC